MTSALWYDGGEKKRAHFSVLTDSILALSALKVPSGFVSEERFSKGMALPLLGATTGPAAAMRASATVTRVALQNMVGAGATSVE